MSTPSIDHLIIKHRGGGKERTGHQTQRGVTLTLGKRDMVRQRHLWHRFRSSLSGMRHRGPKGEQTSALFTQDSHFKDGACWQEWKWSFQHTKAFSLQFLVYSLIDVTLITAHGKNAFGAVEGIIEDYAGLWVAWDHNLLSQYIHGCQRKKQTRGAS